MGLLFSHRRVPSCCRRASHTGERRLRLPCVRCLALPGMGRCRCTCSTLFALRGKSASELARRFWSVHGKEFFAGRFAHQETFPARRETGNGAVVHFPAGGDVCHLTGGTRPSPGKIFHIILPPQTRHSTRRASSPVRFAANEGRRPRLSSRPPRRASFPRPSCGEICGLCPHPLKGPNP